MLRFRSKNELTQLFKNIDAGKYRTESIKENAFVKDSFKGGPAQIALANIPMDRFLVPRETLTGTKMVPTTICFKISLEPVFKEVSDSRELKPMGLRSRDSSCQNSHSLTA